jgi:hypothetical protein
MEWKKKNLDQHLKDYFFLLAIKELHCLHQQANVLKHFYQQKLKQKKFKGSSFIKYSSFSKNKPQGAPKDAMLSTLNCRF